MKAGIAVPLEEPGYKRRRRVLDGQLMRSVMGVVEATGLSLASVRRLMRRGELGTCRIGRREMIPQRELERFLSERTVRGR